jgi:hypothetical protein
MNLNNFSGSYFIGKRANLYRGALHWKLGKRAGMFIDITVEMKKAIALPYN